jgi:hypothetical protein
MNRFFLKKWVFYILSLLLFCSFCISLTACKKTVDYFSYVSELRDNIFLAENEEYSLQAYSIVKEAPYIADGIVMERSRRIEVRFIAPQGDKNCSVTFSLQGKDYGGEFSFDNVKTEYFWSCSLDVSTVSKIDFEIVYGEEKLEMQAVSVLKGTELSPRDILNCLHKENKNLFSGLTDKYGFSGEIYIRLIYEENPYYYVGIIDRNGKIYAFLSNAITGKTLAKRET